MGKPFGYGEVGATESGLTSNVTRITAVNKSKTYQQKDATVMADGRKSSVVADFQVACQPPQSPK